ncbi:U6 snRNA-associated Sm-like protein LSm2 [Enteropsectra breve]|nr:U6 snRNA-associated Sm-like protein LSm2 [Enteropsectra breve]
MLIYEFLRQNGRKKITLHLKNSMTVSGTVANVDPFLNITLTDAEFSIIEPSTVHTTGTDHTINKNTATFLLCNKMPTCSIRGSSVKMVRLSKNEELLERVSNGTLIRCCLSTK